PGHGLHPRPLKTGRFPPQIFYPKTMERGLVPAVLIAAAPAFCADPAGDYFETRVRRVLAKNCYSCHTDAKMGGLQLDTRGHAMAGGKSGPGIVPGDPENSRIGA